MQIHLNHRTDTSLRAHLRPHLIGLLLVVSGTWAVLPLSEGQASELAPGGRHSLISRPSLDPQRAWDRQAQLEATSTVKPTPQLTPLHRKLTRRPVAETPVTGIAPLQQAITHPGYTSAQAQQSTIAGALAVPSQTTQTPPSTAPVAPNAGLATRSLVAAAAIGSAGSPAASASQPQPMAALNLGGNSGNSSGGAGLRNAFNLLRNTAIVNLLQAPPPPVVVPPSPPPTTPPSTPPTTPPSQPPSSTTGSATLSWIVGSEPDLAGYKVFVGTSSGNYNYPGSPFAIGKVGTYTISNLPKGQTYFFAISAYDNSGNDSPLSGEVSKSVF